MNELVINRQHDKPDFGELSRMIGDLKDFLNETPNFNDAQYCDNINFLVEFQDSNGSFSIFDSPRMPSDARVDFIYMPTYICTAILMKAYLNDSGHFGPNEKTALLKGLNMSTARKLRGHGYDALKGQIEALNIFMKAGLREFIDLHFEMCPEFGEMIENIISKFKDMEVKTKFTGPWGESYEEEIKNVNEYFSTRKVFVYGTLMMGETNHGYLDEGRYLGKSVIEGYDMYDVGWYPAIIPGDNLIVGELYDVCLKDMPSIDMLEGEGNLYEKRCESVRDEDGNMVNAFVYVYLKDVTGFDKISAWGEEYMWYAAYGSNMLYDRFMCYIKGGSFAGSRYHPPCQDTTPPVAVKAIEIPHGMYFANVSGSWHGSGVSFLDVTQQGHAFGVAYLITKRQFEHVCRRENSGREPQPGWGWYEDIIELDDMYGFEVKTLTNSNICKFNEPCPEYLDTLAEGLSQNWPELSDKDIRNYLDGCIR